MTEFQIAEKLSTATPQYLMVVAFGLLIWFGWKVFQELLKLHAKQEEKTTQAQQQTDAVRQRWETASERFSLAIERNTQAFERAEHELKETQTVNREARAVLAKFQ